LLSLESLAVHRQNLQSTNTPKSFALKLFDTINFKCFFSKNVGAAL